MRLSLRNSNVWSIVGASVSCLLLAGALLWLALPTLFSTLPTSHRDAVPISLPGAAFSPAVAASARADGDTLVVLRRPDGEALFNTALNVDAGDNPLLQLELTGLSARSSLMLAWRTAEAPEQTQFVELPKPIHGIVWYAIGQEPAWRGTVTQVALRVFGESSTTPLRLSSMRFHGAQAGSLRRFAWWQWTATQEWPSSYLNWYTGAVSEAVAHPTAVAGIWATLGLALLAVLSRLFRFPQRTAIATGLAIVFIPWLLLDRLWQFHLERQVQLSQRSFAGHSQAEKHYRERDVIIQRYAAHLLRVLPPERGKRLILLHQSSGHNYERLRLQFHLLPHNIYNYDSELPPQGTLRQGDHVLLFGPIAALSFDEDSGVLRDDQRAVNATLIDRHRYGLLYRVDSAGPQGSD